MENGQVFHNGHYFKVWDSHGLSKYTFRSGNFSEDARGRWSFNVVVDVEVRPGIGQGAVGIDPGLKDVATCSDGTVLENARFYRGLEAKLAAAQRARNKKRTRAIHPYPFFLRGAQRPAGSEWATNKSMDLR